MMELFGKPIIENDDIPQPEFVFGPPISASMRAMTASELWERDKAVSEALGFGDLWFPADILDCDGFSPEPPPIDYRLNEFAVELADYPPFSRDWNLAMWAADKSGILVEGIVLNKSGVHWDVGVVNFDEGFVEGLVSVQSGPAAICSVILSLTKPLKPQTEETENV